MNSRTRASVGALVVVLGVVFSAGCRRYVIPMAKSPDAIIVLYKEGTVCKAKLRPKYFVTARGRKVVWEVQNTCGEAHEVRIGNFDPKDKEKDKDPTEPETPGLTVRVNPGSSGEIVAKIKLGNVVTIYTYDAYVDGAAVLDPEMEIWG